MRLFIAIEIPDNLKAALGGLRVDIPGARWVPADQIHLTMAFLGDVEETVVEKLNGALSRIHVPEFKLCLCGIGCFPGRQRPRVLWIGVEPQPHLDELAARVRTAVVACGIPQEERPFSAHITLARLKLSSSEQLEAFLERYKNIKYPAFMVEKFILYQSKLTQQGAVHILTKDFQLTAAEAK